jgi:hypothetical protein
MTTRDRHVLAFVALLTVFGYGGACGGTTSGGTAGGDGGTSEDGGSDGSAIDSGNGDSGNEDSSVITATPRAIVRANGGAAASCVTVPAFVVGDFGDSTSGVPPTPVDNGGLQGGKRVAITCRVAPLAAGGFALAGSVAIAGDGSFTINATLDAQGKTSTASFTLVGTSSWSSTTCSLDPTTRPEQGIAVGRYWATLTCGGASSGAGAMCDIFGELRLENCAQQ